MLQMKINGLPYVSRLALGCMRIHALGAKEAEKLVKTALDLGINFFDHADVYGEDGASERVFAKAVGMSPAVREKMIIQSKCSILKDGAVRYDFSKENILHAVDGILSRLQTEYLDVLLLHRPDTLVEPQEVAEAFDLLQGSGKVRHFGVSNQSPRMIELLQNYVRQPLIINQLQFSPAHSLMVDEQICFNTNENGAVSRSGEVLEYCRLKDITIQPWSPLQYGFFEGTFLGSDKYAPLNESLDRIAKEKGVSKAAVAFAWILSHPAQMQPIVGTTSPAHLAESCQSTDITLSRSEWYEIYAAAGHMMP